MPLEKQQDAAIDGLFEEQSAVSLLVNYIGLVIN